MSRNTGKEPKGEQMDLIDVHPKHSKEMLKLAREYKSAQKERMAAGEVEIEAKKKILGYIKKEKLQPLQDGKIKFSIDGVVFSVTPRDELLRVKFTDDSEDDE